MLLQQRIEWIKYDKKPSIELAQEMIQWGKIMGDKGMVPYVEGYGWAGNLGFREEEIIWVTSSGCIIDRIQQDNIVGITQKDKQYVYFGNPEHKPTSEWEIYVGFFKRRTEINVILHGHDQKVLNVMEKLYLLYPSEVALTKSVTKSGSAEFRDEMLEIITDTNLYLIGREHGFFALEKSFKEAGSLALKFREKAERLISGQQ